ncbi:M15 family metallopeptidase [Undibacterium sp. SXout7W]|uniref:M15 family metallopeptidase n=1 Tax=Undibacterium sp. SXout7W TaxID=3413049 RepID=UPI003BF221D1
MLIKSEQSRQKQTHLPCEQLLAHPDFRRLDSVTGIVIDLRYATENNFVGQNLYGELDCAWLHKEAAHALQNAVRWLHLHYPAYRLTVLDALRPHRIQEILWQQLAGTTLQMYVADPARGSIHSFGLAIDVSLLDEDGELLDMGSDFDAFDETSHPALEAEMLQQGRLTMEHLAHRKILREAMLHGGFAGIHSEWWHFNCGDPELVRQHYIRIM